ncbi:ABC transporter substrate-binding protein [Nocardia sp. AG03]|uniref:ABC transporter substrate-binding protein n=1 Tax=Nocardia sp. AG03 TaxID=3025312 RepID=UPI002418B9D9|nr:ABC transporter substrate-binding protein [Nocardia sp. AG03]
MLHSLFQFRSTGCSARSHPAKPSGAMLGALVAAVALVAAGCGGDTGADDRAEAGPAPISFGTCGQSVTMERTPQRVAILNDGLADTLFALGVGDKIVAKTRGESSPTPELSERLAALPSLGTRNPSAEALVAAQPDLLVADQVAKVSGNQGSPSIDELRQLGIATYVADGGCAQGLTADTTGVDSLFADIDRFGTIFGIEEQAATLAGQLRARLDDIRARTGTPARVDVVEVSQVGGQLYVTTGGMSGDVLERAGGNNLFAELPGQYAPISAEQVIARNPQVIIVDDYTASESGRKTAIDFLTSTFPTTDAVRNGRVLAIDAARTGARGSIRVVDGVDEIARFLYPNAFAGR